MENQKWTVEKIHNKKYVAYRIHDQNQNLIAQTAWKHAAESIELGEKLAYNIAAIPLMLSALWDLRFRRKLNSKDTDAIWGAILTARPPRNVYQKRSVT